MRDIVKEPLSEQIYFAIKALCEFENLTNSEVEMSGFTRLKRNGVVCVDFSGAANMKAYNEPYYWQMAGEKIEIEDTYSKHLLLESILEWVRIGDIRMAIAELHGIDSVELAKCFQIKKFENEYDITDYHDDAKKFKRDMSDIAKILKKEGL